MSLLKTKNTLIVKKTRNIKRLKRRIPSYYCNFNKYTGNIKMKNVK